MIKFVILSTLALMASAQNNGYHSNPKTAAIISEQRYLSGDGKFGAAYTQEDGTDFKEETDSDGTRHGSYSYIDPTGQKRTVSYTAGKNGFQASGDHLPVAPPAPAQPAPQPQYQPQQQYQQQPQQHFQQQQRADNDYDDGSYDPRYNDPSYSQNTGHVQQQIKAQPQYHHQPQPQQPQQQQHHHQQQQQQPNYNQYNNNQQQQNYEQHTTPNPHRFQPPGKLQLNRTPDGFSYSFNKV